MRPACPKIRTSAPIRYRQLFALPAPELDKYDLTEEDSGISSEGPSTSSSEILVQPVDLDTNTSKELYEDLYGHYSSHEIFLRDSVVAHAFYTAICKNPNLFEDKIVLNIGCGVGAYALFAASVGAAHVYAVDNSSIVNYTKTIIETNKRSHQITILHGTVQEIELPVSKVDIILCDWVGYALFFNSLIPSVLYARDKWLIPNGVIYPDKARFHIAGVENPFFRSWKVDWWRFVFEFNMSALREIAVREPLTDNVEDKHIKTTSYCLADIDLNKLPAGTDFDFPFRINALSDSYIHAFVTYFDVHFSRSFQKVKFSTDPCSRSTAYAQTSFLLSGDLPIKQGETISGRFKVKEIAQNKTTFELQVDCDGEVADYHQSHEFVMTRHRL